jgi:MFS family permease
MSPVRPLQTLRHPRLFVWVLARLASGTLQGLLRAVFLWQIYALTQSSAHLGLMGLLQFLPVPIAGLLGGVAADRIHRKRIIIAAQVVTLCATLLLSSLHQITIEILYALVVVISVSSAFEAPSRQAVLPSLVPREEFQGAVTVFATVQAIAFMSGPFFAGVVIAKLSVNYAYFVASGLSALSLLLVIFVPIPQLKVAKQRLSESIREGVAFVRTKPVILGAMTLDMFAVVFGGVTALLPIYATDILRVGPSGYGLLTSCLEIGALATSFVLMFRKPIERLGRALFISVVCYALMTIVFGLSRSLPLSIFAYIAVGAADQVSVVIRSTIVQTSTPDALRGRVSSVNMIFIGASNQLGAAESGFVAALTSPTFAVVSGGVMSLFVVAVVYVLVRELRTYAAESPA